VRVAFGELDAGAFAFVMATGILSVAAAQHRQAILSDALLALACMGWLVLAAAVSLHALRAAERRPRLQSFAVVAATAVVGARFTEGGQGTIGLALWGLALLFWVALLAQRPVFAQPFAGALLVVVGTESLAVLAALVAPGRSQALLWVALVVWGLGLLLYPLVIAVVATAERRGPHFEPELWIVMGALAIATLAAAEIVLAARASHGLVGLGRWLPDVDLATWSLALSLVIPLVALDVRSGSHRYSASRWGFVFPLGMYSVASEAVGHVEHFELARVVSDTFAVAAAAAWTVVFAGLIRRALAG
jgi:tellurite resistance protein TehA-like permease